MDSETILIMIGAFFFFFSFFVKTLKIRGKPLFETTRLSRILSFIIGVIFIFSSQGIFSELIAEYKNLVQSRHQEIMNNPKTSQRRNEIFEKPTTSNNHSSTPKAFVAESGKGSAFIDSDRKLVTCRRVSRMNPSGITSQFKPGDRVYVWAQVKAPHPEVVTIKWYNPAGKLDMEKPIKINKNMGAGYRIYHWRQFSTREKGIHTVKIFNSKKQLIGELTFKIV